jgi:hypothetical protein
MIEFDCKHCDQSIRLGDDKAGLAGICPHCSKPVVAPAKEAERLHDAAFIAKPMPAPIEVRRINVSPTPPGLANRAMTVVGNLTGWAFGLIFVFSFLSTVWSYPLPSLFALAGALLIIPPAYKKLSEVSQLSISPASKVLSGLVLFVLFGLFYSNALSNTAAANKAVAEKQAAQIRQDTLAANKASLITQANDLLAQGNPTAALEVVKQYQGLGDAQVDAVIAKAEQKLKASADEARIAELTGQLAKTTDTDLDSRVKIYEELRGLAPGNVQYQLKASALAGEVAQRAAKDKAAELAAAALNERRASGLVWRYPRSQDEMTQKPVSRAQVDSSNALSFDFPYGGVQRATLELRKHPRWGTSVILMIERGQFLCNDYDGCTVLVRFGSGAPQRFSASGPSDNSTTYIFLEGYNKFISQLRNVDEVTIEAKFFQEGNRVMKFATDGLTWQ